MSEIVSGIICIHVWCFLNGRMQFSKWPRPNVRSQTPIYFKTGNKFQIFKSPHLAILIIIWHTWEARSRKVNSAKSITCLHVARKKVTSAYSSRGWHPKGSPANDPTNESTFVAQSRVSDFANFSMETHIPNSSGIWHGKYMPILCQEFWIYPNPCVKDFRILDLPKPLRQRFQNFGPTRTPASKISEFWTYWSYLQ